MADVLFRYLLMAQARDRAWYQRAFLRDDRLLDARVERLIESVAIRVEMVAQLEQQWVSTATVPASQASQLRTWREPTPRPPVEPYFEDRVEKFPREGTIHIVKCQQCERGRVECPLCEGRGEERCPRCYGKGRLDFEAPCIACNGRRWVPCHQCHRDRFVTHAACGGSGQVAQYQEDVFTYHRERDFETLVPPEAPRHRLVMAADRSLSRIEEALPELTDEAAIQQAGYDTAELRALVSLARGSRQRMERRARTMDARCLFLETQYKLIPLSGCIARREDFGETAQYWLVGRGDDAIEVAPHAATDRLKATAPAALFVGSASWFAAAGHPWSVTHGSLEALGTAGLVLGTIGLGRGLLKHHEPVQTVALLPCSDRARPFLSCLTTIGAFTNALAVLDRGYRDHLESLTGAASSTPQSRSVIVRRDGRLVRLVEVARTADLDKGALARMSEAVDGLVFLEEPSHPSSELRARLQLATRTQPPEARLALNTETDLADTAGMTPSGELALDAVRRTFTRELALAFDWAEVFLKLWAPIAEVLRA